MELNQIEERVAQHDQMLSDHAERITKHGHELDEVNTKLAEIQVHDQYRDKSLARMESKMDGLGGKIDNVTVQIANVRNQPANEKAELYDRIKWNVITLIAGAVVGLILSQMGIK